MERQFVHRTLGMVIVTIALIGCQDFDSVANFGPSQLHISDIVGTWYQVPLNGDESAERTLDLSYKTGTLIHPDRTGLCGGEPELIKQFIWKESPEDGLILQLTVFTHNVCGVEQNTPYKEHISYTKQGDYLRIFSHNWMLKP